MSLRLKTQHHVNGVVLGLFFVVLRGFFEDKTACVPFAFLCHIDTLPSVRRGNCAFFGIENGHLSLYREKAREEKEGERRLWERCANRLRFSTVSIAAAREKRERWLSRSGGLPPLFCSPFSP